MRTDGRTDRQTDRYYDSNVAFQNCFAKALNEGQKQGRPVRTEPESDKHVTYRHRNKGKRPEHLRRQ